jgi:hypothetical protein
MEVSKKSCLQKARADDIADGGCAGKRGSQKTDIIGDAAFPQLTSLP